MLHTEMLISRILIRQNRGVFQIVTHQRLPNLCAEMIDALMVGDGKEEGFERLLRIDTFMFLPDLDETLLNNLLGQCFRLCQLQGELVEARNPSFVQRLETVVRTVFQLLQ